MEAPKSRKSCNANIIYLSIIPHHNSLTVLPFIDFSGVLLCIIHNAQSHTYIHIHMCVCVHICISVKIRNCKKEKCALEKHTILVLTRIYFSYFTHPCAYPHTNTNVCTHAYIPKYEYAYVCIVRYTQIYLKVHFSRFFKKNLMKILKNCNCCLLKIGNQFLNFQHFKDFL